MLSHNVNIISNSKDLSLTFSVVLAVRNSATVVVDVGAAVTVPSIVECMGICLNTGA